MKILDIEQRSIQWHDCRRNHIGASETASVMGIGYNSPYQVWLEKIGMSQPKKMNEAMERGVRLECQARDKYNQITGFDMIPIVGEDEEFPFMMASFDGMTCDKKNIVEIKVPGDKNHRMALEGQVPTHYYPQLQKQIYVAGLEKVDYFSYSEESSIVIPIERDNVFIASMIQQEVKFWGLVQSFEPPELTEKDIIKRFDNEWQILAQQYLDCQKKIEVLLEEQELLRKSLILSTGQYNSAGAGIKVTKCVRKGSISYSEIEELKNLDLEKHRKKPTESWRITRY